MAIPKQNRAFPIKRRKTEDTLVSWDSVTTADGNAGGISLIDSGLIGSNDFITDQVTVIILGGAANLERQLCTAFNPATGEVDFSPLSAQIVAGTPYRLTGLMSPEVSVAGLAADLAVPLPNSANNVLMRDVVGNKTDTPVSTVSATASLMAYMKAIINGAGGTGKIYLGIAVPAAGSLTINNDVLCVGNIMVGAGGTLAINGDVDVTGYVTNAGAVTITGKLNISGDSSAASGYLDNTGGTQFTVGGDAYVAGSITNTTGKIYFEGNLKQGYGTFSNALGGVILIDGDFITIAAMTNAGIMDINGDLIDTAYSAQVNNTTGSLQVEGNCIAAQGISCGVGGNIAVGNLQTLYILNGNATIAVYGNCQVFSYISNSGGGSITINGNCQVGTHIVNPAGSTMTIKGKLDINGDSSSADGYLDNTGGGNITITGDTYISGNLINPTAVITIEGILRCNGTITNAGTLIYLGVYPETPVNISAVSTGGTDVLNLAAVAGYHYTVSKLRLKCANPGANTVTVTLQELINGVLTAVDSFVIVGSLGVNPNYQNYLSLMDMFGLPELFGDQLEVSVESSAGTYAVTGSYSYRSE